MASDLPIDLGLHEGEITKNNSTADVQEEDVRVDQAKELGPTDDLLQQTQLDRVQSWRYSQQTSQLEDDVQMQGALTKIVRISHCTGIHFAYEVHSYHQNMLHRLVLRPSLEICTWKKNKARILRASQGQQAKE